MMLNTARYKREQAMQQLKVVSKKRKSLDTKTHIQASSKCSSSAQPPAKISKKSSQELSLL